MTDTHDPFAGLSREKCADACTPTRCVLSEAAYCWHPRKSGMPSSANRDPKAVARYEAAAAYLNGSPSRAA
jgi:hypothetical protein